MKIDVSLPASASPHSASRGHAAKPPSFEAHLAKAKGAPVQSAIAALKANPNPVPAAFGHLVSAFASAAHANLPPATDSEPPPAVEPNEGPVEPPTE